MTAPTLRIDKWLWFARFFKTRTLAARVVSGGQCRVNGTRVSKPAYAVSPGDVLTFPQGDHVRVIEVVELGTRRGPAPEAQALYTDRDPPLPRPADPSAPQVRAGGRPTKKDRRTFDKAQGQGPA